MEREREGGEREGRIIEYVGIKRDMSPLKWVS